jgi:hypothetical protein
VPDPEIEEQNETPAIRQMRERIKAQDAMLKDLSEKVDRGAVAERKLAFAEAGIPLNDPKLTYFIRGYEGELTPEAITAEAAKAGFIKQSEPGAGDDDRSVFERHREASVAPGLPPGAQAQYQAELEAAQSQEDIVRIAAKYGRLSNE